MITHRYQRPKSQELPERRAPLRRPGARLPNLNAVTETKVVDHENQWLRAYETQVKDAFDRITTLAKKLAAMQFNEDFVEVASEKIVNELDIEAPKKLLCSAWTSRLDIKQLISHLTLATYLKFVTNAVQAKPLAHPDCDEFVSFLTACGFHRMDITPCADGRLAHLIRYVLRLPAEIVRRKAYAGAIFAIEDNVAKWAEVELQRQQGVQLEDTKYLKVVAYHFSSIEGDIEGCAAHGSDDLKAAESGRDALYGFQSAVGQIFNRPDAVQCLLIGVDTATDSIYLHVPDNEGLIDIKSPLQATDCIGFNSEQIKTFVDTHSPHASSGMRMLASRLIENNLAQLAYVKFNHNGFYPDFGHAERFIGIGIGFDEIQLRNLMYFGYLTTVEENVTDIDVGLKIFERLNQSRGLATPIVIRFDYYGSVTGARERAIARAFRVSEALKSRYSRQFAAGDIHYLQIVRDLETRDAPQVLGSNIQSLAEDNFL